MGWLEDLLKELEQNSKYIPRLNTYFGMILVARYVRGGGGDNENWTHLIQAFFCLPISSLKCSIFGK